MENVVSNETCKERHRCIDERCARDKQDIKNHEETINELQKLTTEISQLAKQHAKQIENHEKRLDTLEHKPSVWLDRIVSGIIAAFIAALVAAILSGNVKF